MSMDLELIVSLTLGVLLVAMIVSAVRLSRRLDALRDGNGEMRALIESLNAATERAHAGISQLRTASQETHEKLQGETKKARALADELALMTSAGDDLANRLEARLTAAPAAKAEQAAPVSLASRMPRPGQSGGDSGRREGVLQALRGVR
ncbi:MAG: hypothetical protein Tsb0016_03950 [Sphingomonadales bacterium]